MVNWLQIIKNFPTYVKEFGLTCTLKYHCDQVGVINYSTFEYPVKNIKVTVRTDPFWKSLEKRKWEFMCIKHASDVIKPGQVIFDVGSWIGPYTLLFSKLVHDTGQVYAFDCDPKAITILSDNLKRNHVTNAYIENICMSNSAGQADFKSNGGFSTSSLINHEKRVPFKSIKVETSTIDKYCEEKSIFPNGIKIDVEGAEGAVIKGCRNTLKKYHPWVLLEFHGMYMSEKEKRINWYDIVDSSQKIVFIDGDSLQYQYGSEVKSLPDCQNFHVFLRY